MTTKAKDGRETLQERLQARIDKHRDPRGNICLGTYNHWDSALDLEAIGSLDAAQAEIARLKELLAAYKVGKPVENIDNYSPPLPAGAAALSSRAADIIAGIKQFGLAADGSDLRDLQAIVDAARQPEAAPEGWRTDIQNAPKEGFFLIRKYDDHYKTKVVSTGYFERETANAYIDGYEGAWWELCDAVKGESLMIDGPLEDCDYEWKPLNPTPASAVASDEHETGLAQLAKEWRVEFFKELDSYVVCTDGDVIFFGDPNHKNPDDKELFEKIVAACQRATPSRDAGLEEAAELERFAEWLDPAQEFLGSLAGKDDERADIAFSRSHLVASALRLHAENIRALASAPAPASAQEELVKALGAFVGRLTNVEIDLGTGATKAVVAERIREIIKDLQTMIGGHDGK